MIKNKKYVVNLSKIWPETFSENQDLTVRIEEFVEDWPDLSVESTNSNQLGVNEISFLTDYVTYTGLNRVQQQNNADKYSAMQNLSSELDDRLPVVESQYVYDGVLVIKTGRLAKKEVNKTQRRIVSDANQSQVLIEIKSVDSIPGFTKWVKESDLYTVVTE